MRRPLFLLLAACFLFSATSAQAAVDAGRFQVLHTKIPPGQPLGLAYVISDIAGWNATAESATTELQHDGWLAVGLDLQKYRESLTHGKDECHDVGDELIGLSQQLQRELGIGTYLTPVIVGYGQGGTLAYASIKQALPASFTAGIAIGSSGRLDLPQELCDGPTVKRIKGGGYQYDMKAQLKVPFTAYPADIKTDIASSMRPYQRAIGGENTIADLPLIAMPPVNNTGDTFVIFISGDGGWRDLDKTIAEELHKQGVPVVGWDSLRYFWTRKTPEQLASDLGRVMNHYGKLWNKSRVALIGYSFGADAIPFAYNRLPAYLQDHVSLFGLLGLGQEGSFEIEVEGYIGLDGDSDQPLAPELAKLPTDRILCMYGEEDADDSSCPALKAVPHTRVIATQGGHHFDEDYDAVATQIHNALK